MNATLRRQLLSAILTDSAAEPDGDGWKTRCLHCRTALQFSSTGEPLNGGTLEHVVPRSWFEKRAARELTERVGSANDPRNLALACARCNHRKGSSHDNRGPSDARAREVVEKLLETRMARWKPTPVAVEEPQSDDEND